MISDISLAVIPRSLQLLAMVSSICLLMVILYLVRKERLKEGYSIIWLGVAATLVFFSFRASWLDWLAHSAGITYTPAAFFLIIVAGLLLLCLHFSLLLCRYDARIRALAQEHALLKEELQRPTLKK